MSMSTKILVTRRLPSDVEKRLMDTYETIFLSDVERADSQRLIQHAKNVDAILCTPGDQIGADLIDALPDRLRIISTFSVGYEHIDLAAAHRRGIVVTNTPDVLTDATADLALLLMLGASRRAYEGQKMVREGRWTGWTPTQLLGQGLQDKRLGILGMGRIGQAVAVRARAFGMEVHYHNRTRRKGDEIYHDSADSLLSHSDILSLHCPLTPETKGFLNAARLSLLPENAIVINTARGPVIEDEALIGALKSGQVAAAGLDVFDGEPQVHPGYLELENAYLLPHLGSATIETRNAMGNRALDNLDAFFAGQQPPHAVT